MATDVEPLELVKRLRRRACRFGTPAPRSIDLGGRRDLPERVLLPHELLTDVVARIAELQHDLDRLDSSPVHYVGAFGVSAEEAAI